MSEVFDDLEHALSARGGDPQAWGDHVEETGAAAVVAGRSMLQTLRWLRDEARPACDPLDNPDLDSLRLAVNDAMQILGDEENDHA